VRSWRSSDAKSLRKTENLNRIPRFSLICHWCPYLTMGADLFVHPRQEASVEQSLEALIDRRWPASYSRRGMLRTKSDIAAAVYERVLDIEEACACYALTLDDLLDYRAGQVGFKTERLRRQAITRSSNGLPDSDPLGTRLSLIV
jgi:hypothetical protein